MEVHVFKKRINDAKLFTVDEFHAKDIHEVVGRVNRKKGIEISTLL